jgi:hypothetical protein
MLVLRVLDPGLPLPPGEYGFFEWYCEDPGCDCRRVLLQVCSPQQPGRILAIINYGWESAAFYIEWMHGDNEAGREITSASLDPLNPQSELADALLDRFREQVCRDANYPGQLRRHYDLFKRNLGAEASPDPQTMTIPEILQQLQRVPDKAGFAPYKTALRAAIAQREAITPELIAALDRVSADPAHYLKNFEDCPHLFAIYLLAQFRERGALDAFRRFFSLPGDQALDLTGDMVTENGAAVIASVCGGDPAPLLKLIHDESVNDFVRTQAIDALLVQAGWGERPREAVIDDLRRLFQTLPKPGNAFVWAGVAGAVCDFNAPELMPEVRQVFAEELVDESMIGLEDAEESMSGASPNKFANSASRYETLLERNAPIDAVAECSTWLCFRDEEEDDALLEDEDVFDEADADRFAHEIAYGEKPFIAPPKVGRNDPCPCGSGKKYKKCCGRN